MNPIELSIFARRIDAVCEEMGAQLRFAAFSPNIRDRLDFSCAVFDAEGGLCAQAAHIPVHLGSMAYAMQQIVTQRSWAPGDFVALNDPYLGGTHLPDVTVVCPVFIRERLIGIRRQPGTPCGHRRGNPGLDARLHGPLARGRGDSPDLYWPPW